MRLNDDGGSALAHETNSLAPSSHSPLYAEDGVADPQEGSSLAAHAPEALQQDGGVVQPLVTAIFQGLVYAATQKHLGLAYLPLGGRQTFTLEEGPDRFALVNLVTRATKRSWALFSPDILLRISQESPLAAQALVALEELFECVVDGEALKTKIKWYQNEQHLFGWSFRMFLLASLS